MLFRSSSPVRTGPSALVAFQKKRSPFLRIGVGFCALLVLGGILLGPGNTSVVHAASISLPYNDNGNSENPPLVFYNAIQQYTGSVVVQHHPKVYLLFWGPEWSQNEDGAIINQVLQTFRALPGSQYNNILTQYSDASDYVHNDVQVVASVIDTAAPPSNLDIGFDTPAGLWFNAQARYEADKAIAANNWQITPDSQIIVFPQKGSTYNHGSGFCGVHSFDSDDITMKVSPFAYALIQYGDQNSGCDPTGNVAEDIAWEAVHEYAEMATDPRIFATLTISDQWFVAYGAGWHTEDGTKDTPQEVADLCEGYGGNPQSSGSAYAYNDYQDPDSGTYYTFPLLWSNANNGCVTAMGQDYASPASPGRHTVQGYILQAYQGSGQDVGALVTALGAPMSEELPLVGGRVSYFSGTSCNGGYVFTDELGHKVNSGSAIFYNPSTGTYEVHGCIYQHYESAYGGPAGPLGFPVTDEQGVADGTGDTGNVSYFKGTTCNGGGPNGSGSAIYWDGGAYEVQGCIYAKYQEKGGPIDLGFPVTDEGGITDVTGTGGRVSYFKGTSCNGGGPNGSGSAVYYWSPGVAFEVQGCIYAKYQAKGGPGTLGFPVTDEQGATDSTGDSGRVSYFKGTYCGSGGPNGSGSAVYYWSGEAHEVQGCIYDKYQAMGGLNSALGFPVSDEQGITDYWGDPGRVSYFKGTYCGNGGPDGSGSAIYWWGGAHEVQGCIYAKYQQIGGSNSKLGFPISNEYTNSLGYRESDFSNGEIIWENGTAVVTYETSCVTTGKCN